MRKGKKRKIIYYNRLMILMTKGKKRRIIYHNRLKNGFLWANYFHTKNNKNNELNKKMIVNHKLVSHLTMYVGENSLRYISMDSLIYIIYVF